MLSQVYQNMRRKYHDLRDAVFRKYSAILYLVGYSKLLTI